jgi:hypothetical protein
MSPLRETGIEAKPIKGVAGKVHYLQSLRTVTAIDEQASCFTYWLVFDREILRPVMPQFPPTEEISSWYGGVAWSYLENLEKTIESGAMSESSVDA